MLNSVFIKTTVGKAAIASALFLAAFVPAASQAAPGGSAPRENISGHVTAVHGNTVDIRDTRGFISHVRYGTGAFAPGFALRTGAYVSIWGYNSGPYFAASFIGPFGYVGYGPSYGGCYYGYGYPCYGGGYYGPAVAVGFGYGGWRGYGWRGGYYPGWRGGYYGGWRGGYGGGWHGGYPGRGIGPAGGGRVGVPAGGGRVGVPTGGGRVGGGGFGVHGGGRVR